MTERVNPKWSVILRPPTDKECKDAIRDAAHPFVINGVCPTNPRRDAIVWKNQRSHGSIGEARLYTAVAQEGLEQMSAFCVYGWAKGDLSTCIEPFEYGPTPAEDRQVRVRFGLALP